MEDIREILKKIELHDGGLDAVSIKGDGSVELFIDIDEVWNKDLDPSFKGIRFISVYEVSEYKIDRLNIIGTVEVVSLEDYDREFIVHLKDEPENATMVLFELVAGGSLSIICSGVAELI